MLDCGMRKGTGIGEKWGGENGPRGGWREPGGKNYYKLLIIPQMGLFSQFTLSQFQENCKVVSFRNNNHEEHEGHEEKILILVFF